nr:PREDICTED: cornifelin homolog B-like [Latimeria chalumnae]|eukprot:XP_014349803.1 PREDICTED: cornifelin homolog B-like [Latimeria chalumnae]
MCKTADDFGECMCLPMLDPGMCGGYSGCAGCVPGVSLAMRAAVRERHKIQGNIFNDLCCLYWCYPCVWCQMAREIKKWKQPLTIINTQATTLPTVHVVHQ